MTSIAYSTNAIDFDAQAILITGAAHGIGKALALTCARHNATVILLDKEIPALEKVYDEIVDSGGLQPAIYPLTLEGATEKDYVELANTLGDTFGELRALVHNAALLGTLTPIELYNPELWHQVMQVNLNAPLMLTQTCLPLLAKSQQASLLFVSDTVGRTPKPYWGAYAVSKAALESLSKTLAIELGDESSIRVNSVDPGAVNTKLRVAAYPGASINKWAATEEVAEGLLYLLSDGAGEFRGAKLELDGKALTEL